MLKPITAFLTLLESSVSLNRERVLLRKNRYFLLTTELMRLPHENFFSAGVYLGKRRHGRYFPSLSLLRMIAKSQSNRIVIDDRTEWLFICGRDVFKRGIVEVRGSGTKGSYTLVLNQHDECLGFGRILRDINKSRRGVVVKNVLDIGDFLRREG